MSDLFEEENKLTMDAIKSFPKSYPVWFHRHWILERQSDPSWNYELKLVEKLLDIDPRNCKKIALLFFFCFHGLFIFELLIDVHIVHGWAYRQWIVQKANDDMSLVKNEFEFSKLKIFQNFSNYSAWHKRSKLLEKKSPGDEDCLKLLSQEFEWIHSAIFTEPNDQSPWLYHRWLIHYISKR